MDKKEKYIVIVELPDAHIGTEVIWDENKNHYYYNKSSYVSPDNKNYLTAGQVTQSPKFFKKASEYAEHYAYHEPTYSRKDVLDLIKTVFPNNATNTDNQREYVIRQELDRFNKELREMGRVKAEKLLNNM